VLHNVFYAAFAFIAGWLTDRFRKNLVLAAGYALAALMTILIIVLPASIWMLGAVFILGGIYVGIEETLEDSLCAELVDEAHHGMAFGVLATVNGTGDFLFQRKCRPALDRGRNNGSLWVIAPRFSLQARCWWFGFVREAIPFPDRLKFNYRRGTSPPSQT
jgi:MFS family permease